MEKYKNVPTVYAPTLADWRQWLADHHTTEKSVWLIIYHKESHTPSTYYDEAVDEALCFGWIDSLVNKRDEESYFQYFAKRNPKSNWSKVNKDKIERLLAQDRLTDAGKEMVEIAKKTGTWTALDDVEKLIVPPDLKTALAQLPPATTNFDAFPRSVKRGILEWLLNAKRSETRQKRITEIAEMAQRNERANQYRP